MYSPLQPKRGGSHLQAIKHKQENIKYPLFLSLSFCAYTNQPIFNSLEGPIVYDKLMSISDQVVSHTTNYPSKGNISKSEATNTTLSTRACMN